MQILKHSDHGGAGLLMSCIYGGVLSAKNRGDVQQGVENEPNYTDKRGSNHQFD